VVQENVGGNDLTIRWLLGPALLLLGLTALGARRGRPGGLLALVAGTSVVESAITRTCPLNHVLGIDTRR
jgi:hypothetical protein